VAYSGKTGSRNVTATMLYKQTLARQDRKMSPPDLVGPALVLYGDDEFVKKVWGRNKGRPQRHRLPLHGGMS
jgi:hypothetical protein